MSDEILAATVPEEPPLNSVVLDREGVAWQSRKAFAVPQVGWVPAGAISSFVDPDDPRWLPFARLVVERGPLQVIHRAEPPQERA
jgi:hypothetical protein